jgi:hypothetical protein
MPFNPNVNDVFKIDGLTYTAMEHPSARGMPYGQRGRQATVFQLRADNGMLVALKVFIQNFRTPTLVERARRLREFAPILGLKVCDQMVLTPERHGPLLNQHSDLNYAVLMPWVVGETWQDVLMGGQPLTRDQSQIIATLFAGILAGMEERGVAHCDLSGPNVLMELSSFTISLVDVEELYAPTLSRPGLLPSGTPGYGHRTSGSGMWGPEVDRFSGAVLLAEMLCWHDPRIRQGWFGEQFFDPNEIQSDCPRYHLLTDVLQECWGRELAEAFARAWRSAKVADCPRLGEWLNLIAPRREAALDDQRTAIGQPGAKPTPPPVAPPPRPEPQRVTPPPPIVEAPRPTPAPVIISTPPPPPPSSLPASPSPMAHAASDVSPALAAARTNYCLSERLEAETYAQALLAWADASERDQRLEDAFRAYHLAAAIAPPASWRAQSDEALARLADHLVGAAESDDGSVTALMGLAADMEKAENYPGALMTYRRVLALASPAHGIRAEALAAVDFLKANLAAAQMFGGPTAKIDYTLPASVRHPASIVFLINLSRGFNAMLAHHLLTSLVRGMAAKAARGSIVTPCYRIAIVAYHREVIDLLEGFKDLDRLDAQGIPMLQPAPADAADVKAAFEYIEKLLRKELTIHSSAFFPAPQVIHLTGGRLTGDDPVRAAKRLQALGQADGNVLLQTVWLGDDLNGMAQDIGHWPGLKPGAPGPIEEPWLQCSSPLPGMCRAVLRQAGYRLESGTVMLWPGQQLKILTSLLPEVGEW